MKRVDTMQRTCLRRFGALIARPPVLSIKCGRRLASSLPIVDRTAEFCDLGAAPSCSLEGFGLLLVPDFLSEAEHDALVAEVERDEALRRRGFSEGHWDAVITGYRETEILLGAGSPLLRDVASRAYSLFGPASGPPIPRVHVLELSPRGRIDAHVDSVKFSGGVVAVASLCSDAILVLRHVPTGDITQPVPPSDEATVSVYVPRRSIYVMQGEARYRWSHAILQGTAELSLPPLPCPPPTGGVGTGTGASPEVGGGGQKQARRTVSVTRGRRISLVFRDELVEPLPEGSRRGHATGGGRGYGALRSAGAALSSEDGDEDDDASPSVRFGRLTADGELEEGDAKGGRRR